MSVSLCEIPLGTEEGVEDNYPSDLGGKAVGTVLGLGGQKMFFFISHLHIKGIQFSSLVYL